MIMGDSRICVLFGNTVYVYMFVDMTRTRVEYLERLSQQGLCLDFLVFAVPGIAKGLTVFMFRNKLYFEYLEYMRPRSLRTP